jgi:hypothetical protein
VNGIALTKIHAGPARSIVLADRTANATDEIIIDFGPGVGLWQLQDHDATAWTRLHASSPEMMLVGRFH